MLNIIIGEKINSSIMENFNDDNIISLIKSQAAGGADYLDINTAVCDDEFNMMKHIIDLVCEYSECGICIDSPSADVIVEVAEYVNQRQRPFILNSVTLTERIDKLIPIAIKYDCYIIAMPIIAFGEMVTSDERLNNAETLLQTLIDNGVSKDKIIMDMVVESLMANDSGAAVTIDVLKRFKQNHSDIRTLCGISNISYGLPERQKINSAFLSSVIQYGADCVILDVTSQEIKTTLHIANMLNGDDEYCMDYINYIRSLGK